MAEYEAAPHGRKAAVLRREGPVPVADVEIGRAERVAALALINTPASGDLSIGQVWARELDEGR